MSGARLVGIFAVKLPVRDLERARAWYERVFGFEVEIEFPDDDGVVKGVAGRLPGVAETRFALRQDPPAAEGAGGFNYLNLAVADHEALHAWVARLDELGVDHSPVIEATIGWILVLHDPDGTELHLYTVQRHARADVERPGRGRLVAPATG